MYVLVYATPSVSRAGARYFFVTIKGQLLAEYRKVTINLSIMFDVGIIPADLKTELHSSCL